MISYRQHSESSGHNQTFHYHIVLESIIFFLFLVSLARTSGMNLSVERQEMTNKPDYKTIFLPKISSNHYITRDDCSSSIQTNFQKQIILS